MKTILIILITVLTLSINAQEYIITENKSKYGIADKKGDQIFKNIYTRIYMCEKTPNFFIGEGKKFKYFLLDSENKKTYELIGNEDNLRLDDKCLLTNSDKIKFIEKGKMGMLQFPNKVKIPAKYKMIYPFDYYKDACLLEDKNKYRIFYYKTEKATDWFEVYNEYETLNFDNDMSYIFNEEFFIARMNDKVKLMNLEGKSFNIEKTDFENNRFEEFYAFLTKKNNKYGYVDYSGQIVIPLIYDDAGPLDYDLGYAYVKQNGKYGYINSSGNLIIPCVYDKAENFKDSYAKVTINNIEFLIDDIAELKEGLEPNCMDIGGVDGNCKYGYENYKGEKIIDYQYDGANFFTYGLASVKKGEKWGYITQIGSVFIDFKFEEAKQFQKNIAVCKLDGKWGFIDLEGNFIFKNTFDDAEIDLYPSKLLKVGKLINGKLKYGIVDDKGNMEIDFKYDDIGDASLGKTAVKLGKKWGFADNKGDIIIDCKYDKVTYFYNNISPVKLGDKWGYIDNTGKMVIDAIYDTAANFFGNTTTVKKDGKQFKINMKGECVKNCP